MCVIMLMCAMYCFEVRMYDSVALQMISKCAYCADESMIHAQVCTSIAYECEFHLPEVLPTCAFCAYASAINADVCYVLLMRIITLGVIHTCVFCAYASAMNADVCPALLMTANSLR